MSAWAPRFRLPWLLPSTAVGRKVDVDNIVGAEEIADRLGLSSYQRVHELRRRHADFPPPIKKLRRTMIWNWPDVQRWAKAHGRLDQRHGGGSGGDL